MPLTPATTFPVVPHPLPASAEARAAIVANPVFGKSFSDHMARATWREGEGWTGRKIEALAPLPIHPAAIVVQYGQQVFEGMKAYKWADGSIRLFRPDRNAARLTADAAWVPDQMAGACTCAPRSLAPSRRC